MIGGSELSTKLLAEELVRRGHKVTVLTFDRTKKTSSSENMNGVSVIRYKTFTRKALFLTLIPYVASAMKEWENSVDIYHVYNVQPLPGARIYKIFGGKKKAVATLNNYIAFCPVGSAVYGCKDCNLGKRFRCLGDRSIECESTIERITALLYSIVYPVLTKMSKNLDNYVALSKSVKESYVRFGFSEKKIKIIPNFMQYNFSKKMYSKPRNSDFFNVLYVGRMMKTKGVHILINAFSKVAGKHKNVRLILVGTGSKIDDFKVLARNLDIDGKVTFAGYVSEEEKHKYYSEADLFVHPAIWQEPFGRALLEAMSFEIPLIVSNVGAPPEVIGDAGLVFESGNVEDLERKIEMIIDNSKLGEKLKSKCMEVLKKYDSSYILDEIVELYRTTLNEHNS